MKKVLSALLIVLFAVGFAADAQAKDKMKQDIRKLGQARGNPVDISVDIGFSGEFGNTITDERGTCFNYFGMSFFEPKIYPSEYWGVFPLYFFGWGVGISVNLVNNSDLEDATLRISTECYCLKTDGSNGAQLLAPTFQDVVVGMGGTAVLDASFVGEYVDGAESGLDRFLVKVYSADTVTYQVVQDADNSIKFEDAPVGLGEDGAQETDTFIVYVDGAAEPVEVPEWDPSGGGMPPLPPVDPPVSVRVKTKAGTGVCETILTGDGATALDSLGFQVTLVCAAPSAAMLTVSSVSNRHALSHVEFIFRDGAQVMSPLNGESYEAERETLEDSESTLIQVKEGVFCPPVVDEALMGVMESVLGK